MTSLIARWSAVASAVACLAGCVQAASGYGSLGVHAGALITHTLSGPLVALAGYRAHPTAWRLWQPFVGGLPFVILQAFGWALYACTLLAWPFAAQKELATIFIGLLSLTAATVLTLSLDVFAPAGGDSFEHGEHGEHGERPSLPPLTAA
eukprot:3068295-Prymnesium_polylepis.1